MLTLTDVCVCVCVSLSIISGEEKGKDGAELILSVYQKLHPPVIEFSPSPIVVVFVGTGWSVFSPLRWSCIAPPMFYLTNASYK